MSDFIFELANSATKAKIGELTQARDRSLQLALNKAGALSFRLPLVDSLSAKVEEVETYVRLKLLGVEIWSGPVWSVTDTVPDSLVVNCVGWLQTLEKRVSKPWWLNANGTAANPLIYTDVDAGDIAFDLLARSNADGQYGPDYVVPGVREFSQSRTRTYQPFIGILNEIVALSEIESGYDFIVDSATRQLNIFRKIGEIKSKVVFEYGANLKGASRSTDSARICNRFIAYSAAGYAISEDEDSQQIYGLFEEAQSLADVTDIAILQAYADAEVAIRSMPLPFHSFDPKMNYTGSAAPRIFQDYNVGDICYLKVNRGRYKTGKQAVRLFGLTVGFDNDSGQEIVSSIQTTAGT
jgi:hypothetical protein